MKWEKVFEVIMEDNMDREYWNEFYKKGLAKKEPTLFAQYVSEKYLEKGKTVLELGCGNGRDSLYFAQKDLDVIAIDGADQVIEKLKVENCNNKVKFIQDDFVTTNIYKKEKIDYVYSRFTLHAITEEQENILLKNVYNGLEAGGDFFIEVRSVKDDLYGKGENVGRNAYFYNNHYRRFLIINELEEKLQKTGFTILYSEESKNFAPYKDQNPYVIRMIAKK